MKTLVDAPEKQKSAYFIILMWYGFTVLLDVDDRILTDHSNQLIESQV